MTSSVGAAAEHLQEDLGTKVRHCWACRICGGFVDASDKTFDFLGFQSSGVGVGGTNADKRPVQNPSSVNNGHLGSAANTSSILKNFADAYEQGVAKYGFKVSEVEPAPKPPIPLLFRESWDQVPVKMDDPASKFVSPFCMQAGVGFDAAGPPEEKAANEWGQQHSSTGSQQSVQHAGGAQLQPSLSISELLKEWDANGSGVLLLDSLKLPSLDLGWASRSSGLPDLPLSRTPSRALYSNPTLPPVPLFKPPIRSEAPVTVSQRADPPLRPYAAAGSEGPTTAFGRIPSFSGNMKSPAPADSLTRSFREDATRGACGLDPSALNSLPRGSGPASPCQGRMNAAVGDWLDTSPRHCPTVRGPFPGQVGPGQGEWRKRSGFGGLFPRNMGVAGAQGLDNMSTLGIQGLHSESAPASRGPGLPGSAPLGAPADTNKGVIQCQPSPVTLQPSPVQGIHSTASIPQPHPRVLGASMYPPPVFPTWMDYVRSIINFPMPGIAASSPNHPAGAKGSDPPGPPQGFPQLTQAQKRILQQQMQYAGAAFGAVSPVALDPQAPGAKPSSYAAESPPRVMSPSCSRSDRGVGLKEQTHEGVGDAASPRSLNARPKAVANVRCPTQYTPKSGASSSCRDQKRSVEEAGGESVVPPASQRRKRGCAGTPYGDFDPSTPA
eukprot:jgi/Botrbrau1/20408/Bobra.0006s0065.1